MANNYRSSGDACLNHPRTLLPFFALTTTDLARYVVRTRSLWQQLRQSIERAEANETLHTYYLPTSLYVRIYYCKCCPSLWLYAIHTCNNSSTALVLKCFNYQQQIHTYKKYCPCPSCACITSSSNFVFIRHIRQTIFFPEFRVRQKLRDRIQLRRRRKSPGRSLLKVNRKCFYYHSYRKKII